MYTEEQYEYLRMCADGLVWEWFKDSNGDEVLHFLASRKEEKLR